MSFVADEALAVLVQKGDHSAFGELMRRYEPKMIRYGQRFLSVAEDIEDIVQDIFVTTYTNIKSYNSSYAFSPWMYRIAHNTFANELRRRSRRPILSFSTDVLLPRLRGESDVEAEVIAAEEAREMEVHLKHLSAHYREIIILYYFEELSYSEIADVLRIPTTTVGVRLSRAKTKLKKIIEHHDHT
jgi:RNA polymerase sigma-70 factor, ECF subfamily